MTYRVTYANQTTGSIDDSTTVNTELQPKIISKLDTTSRKPDQIR